MTAVPMTAVAVGTTSVLRLDCELATATPECVSESYINPWRGQGASRRLAVDTLHRYQRSVNGVRRELGGGIAKRVHSGGQTEENHVRLRRLG